MTTTAHQGETLMKVLQERGSTRRGWADATAAQLTTLTGLDSHDIHKMLYAWRKLGYIRATERKDGKATFLTGIRLTERGKNIDLTKSDVLRLDEVEVEVGAANGHSAEAEGAMDKRVDELLQLTSEPTEVRVTAREVVALLPAYPLLAALVGRRDRLLQAAVDVENDAPDLAMTLMSRADRAYTPLEEETVGLLTTLGLTPKKEAV